MKKFGKFASLILCMLVLSVCIFAGCTPKGFKDNPATNAVVTGNGGLAVQKGNYLYFVNGYDTYANAGTGLSKGALYRTKLTSDYSTNLNENNYLSSADKVVDLLVGYEYGGFYIYDDYIYYATPILEKDKSGNTLLDQVRFCKVNINGTDNKTLYQTDVAFSSGTWTVEKIDGTVYFVVFDGSQIYTVSSSGAFQKVADATSMTTTTRDTYDGSALLDSEKYVYYTRSRTESESGTGNILAKAKIGTSTEEIIESAGKTYTLVDYKNDAIYYNDGTNLIRYRNSNKKTICLVGSYSSIYILDDTNNSADTRAVVVNTNAVEYRTYGATPSTKTILSGSATVLFLDNNELFILEDNTIKVIALDSSEPSARDIINNEDVSLYTSATVYYDYDGRSIYFLNEYTGTDESKNAYLCRVDLNSAEQNTEMIGVFVSGQEPTIDSEDEE